MNLNLFFYSAGYPQLHSLMKRPGDEKKVRRRCRICYKNHRALGYSPKDSMRLAKTVSTYCAGCDRAPTLCMNCFKDTHSVQVLHVDHGKNMMPIAYMHQRY